MMIDTTSHISTEPLVIEPQQSSCCDQGNGKTAVCKSLLIVFAGYTCLGAILFYVFEHDWSILDSLHFSITTVTTIGYGDVSPNTDAMKLLCVFYVLGSFVLFGYTLGFATFEVVRRNTLRLKAIRKARTDRLIKYFSDQEETHRDESTGQDRGVVNEQVTSLSSSLFNLFLRRVPFFLLIGVVGVIIGHFEEWNLITSLFYSYMTSTTVGTGGEFYPQTTTMKIVALFFIPVSVLITIEILGAIAQTIMEVESQRRNVYKWDKVLTEEDLHRMENGDGYGMTQNEFIVLMLQVIEEVEYKKVQTLIDLFYKLDVERCGELDRDNLKQKIISASEIFGVTQDLGKAPAR